MTVGPGIWPVRCGAEAGSRSSRQGGGVRQLPSAGVLCNALALRRHQLDGTPAARSLAVIAEVAPPAGAKSTLTPAKSQFAGPGAVMGHPAGAKSTLGPAKGGTPAGRFPGCRRFLHRRPRPRRRLPSGRAVGRPVTEGLRTHPPCISDPGAGPGSRAPGATAIRICGRYSTSCPSSSSQPWELSAKCAGVGMPDSVTVTVVRTPASDPGSGRDSAWAPTRVVGFLIRLVAPAPGDQRGFPNHLHPDGERIVEVSAPIERVWRAVSDADDTSANHCAISAAPDEDSVATGFQLPGRRRSG